MSDEKKGLTTTESFLDKYFKANPWPQYHTADDVLRNAVALDTTEKQLTYLTDTWIFAKRQLDDFGYDEWVKLHNIKKDDAYDVLGTEPDGYEFTWPLQESEFQNQREIVERWFDRFTKTLKPHMLIRAKILGIPQSIVTKLPAVQIEPEKTTDNRFTWLKANTLLEYLFDQLIENGYIKTGEKKLIESNFKNQKGDKITNHSLSQMKSNRVGQKPKRGAERVDAVIQRVKDKHNLKN